MPALASLDHDLRARLGIDPPAAPACWRRLPRQVFVAGSRWARGTRAQI